jgi:hypothetical protein
MSGLVVCALAPYAHEDMIFVYDLSGVGSGPSVLSGSITMTGQTGDTVPLLDASAVTSFQFATDSVPFNNTSTILSDSMAFNGTLGASTLTGTSGSWQIVTAGGGGSALHLYGQPDTTRYDELWGWCVIHVEACAAIGNGPWTLTLASETSTSPEPATAGLLLGALAVFCVRRRLAQKVFGI